jgi:hypothetical protein
MSDLHSCVVRSKRIGAWIAHCDATDTAISVQKTFRSKVLGVVEIRLQSLGIVGKDVNVTSFRIMVYV